MQNRERYKSSIGFTDLLFNLVIGFVYLFMIAFILINPVAKKGDVIKKAEYIIVIEWNNELDDDIDLWVKDPQGNTVSFVQKNKGLMNLEKDDLGYGNDTKWKANGEKEIVYINREVVTLRGTVPGEYQIAAHVYNRRPSRSSIEEGKIRVQVIKINPYVEVYTEWYDYNRLAQEIALVNIVLDEDGNVESMNNNPNSIITRKIEDNYLTPRQFEKYRAL